MVAYEDAVDNMTNVCIRKMQQFANESRLISVPDFMQFYAFDVIGEITVNSLYLIPKRCTVELIQSSLTGISA
jgi:hypothetical protein